MKMLPKVVNNILLADKKNENKKKRLKIVILVS
jgi:hypothetical protein